MKFWKVIISAVFAITLFGCASKYQAPQTIKTEIADATKAQVKAGILAAGTQGKAAFGTWKMKVINDSTIQGTLFNRGYEVSVSIPYTSKGYTIKYLSASDNLKDKNGNLHRNYNRWTNNLDQKIRQNIFVNQ